MPRLTEYIPHEPTAKQAAFLLLDQLDAFYGGAAGGGKALSANSSVCTPFGFRKMSDIKVGDRICSVDGGNSQVIGVYPQGEQQLYTFTFSDGSKVDATLDHLWKYSIAGKGKWKKSGLVWKLATTEQIIRMMEEEKAILIPLAEPIQFTRSYRHDYRQIHPYVLGCLLGDGSMRISPVKIHSADPELVERMQDVSGMTWHRYGDTITYRVLGEDSKELTYWLKANKLFGHNHYTKFIPEQYKYSSVDSRFELLRGLMDTDGYCSESGKAYFSSASKQLATDVQWIVRSLGGNATITESMGSYTKDGERCETQINYGIYIRMPDNSEIFALDRKKKIATKYNGGRFVLKKKIVKIEKAGSEQAICIKIDRPDGLFITDDFVVTHNSDALLMAALQYVDVKDYAALLLRDTYKNLTMPGSLLDRADEWLYGTSAKWDGDAKTYRFPSGATITFGYLDGPRDHLNYKSAEFQFIGIDEASDLRWSQMMYMFSRLRRLEGFPVPLRFRLASNPGGISHLELKTKYIDRETREEGVVFIPAGLDDNPYLDRDTYKRNLMNLDPVTREQLLKGDWDIREKGRMFDRSWFQLIESYNPDNIVSRVRYWDLAATEPHKTNKEPAYTCGAKLLKTKSGQYIIESIIRFRKTPRVVEQVIKQTAQLDGIGTEIWMEQEPGSSGVNTIDHYRRDVLPEYTFRPDKVTGSKIERAAPFSSQAEAGNVLILKGSWNKDFLDEAELFPDGKFKDQVDSCSGAYSKIASNSGFRIRSV